MYTRQDYLKQALFYCDLGLSVIPIGAKTKRPATLWEDTFKKGKLFTPEKLKKIWRGNMQPGIGTGRYSGPHGLVVVDADNQAAVDYIEKHCPHTPMQTKHRKDGGHYYFKQTSPEEQAKTLSDLLKSKARWLWEVENKLGLQVKVKSHKEQTEEDLAQQMALVEANKKLALEKLPKYPEIDIRGYGGLVVAPGCAHSSGNIYKMVEPWTREMLENIPVYDEAWFKDAIWVNPDATKIKAQSVVSKKRARHLKTIPMSTRIQWAAKWLEKVEGAKSGEAGHNRTFYVANRLIVGFLLDQEVAFNLMKDEYNNRCQPPWTDKELKHKIKSAMSNRGEENGYMLLDKEKPPREFVVKSLPKELYGPQETVKTELGDEIFDDQLSNAPIFKAQENDEIESEDVDEFIDLWKRFEVDYRDIIANDTPHSLRCTKRGWQIPVQENNIAAILQHSKIFKDSFKYNELKLTKEFNNRRLSDHDERAVTIALQTMWNTKERISEKMVASSIAYVCQSNSYDPPKEFLESLPEWDGIKRIEKVPKEILNADDTPINGTMFRHFMTAMVARMMRPGTKVDNICFLVSEQGAFKSQFFKKLVNGNDENDWFSDSHFDLKSKDGRMLVSTHTLIEWSESEHAKHAKMIDTVKSFLSTTRDDFREPYGRNIVSRPRRCVFCGTSNDEELLHDPSGSRRFYIIRLPNGLQIDLTKLEDWRIQLFAEALSLWRKFQKAKPGSAEWDATRWWFTPSEDKERQNALKDFRARSQWFDDISSWLDELQGEEFSMSRLLRDCLRITTDKNTKRNEMLVASDLKLLGCVKLPRHRGKEGRRIYWQQTQT